MEQLSDLCFTISGLVIQDSSEEEEVARSSSSGLSPEAKAFEPSRKGKEKLEDWEPVPSLVSVSSDSSPTFSQVVVSGSQSVLVTPVKGTTKVKGEDSVEQVIMAQPANFANMTAAQFTAYLAGLADDATRLAAETAALGLGSDAVKLAVMVRREARTAATLQQVQNQMAAVQAQAQAAQVAAQAGGAGGAAPKMSVPEHFENKEKGPNVREWLPTVEEYLAATPANDYIRFASSYLSGKVKTYWNNQYTAWQNANPGAQPADVRQFFRDTLVRGYGVRDPLQSYFDAFWSVSQKPGQSVDEYNVAFTQALTNLGDRITDEDTKIDTYRRGLNSELREMCRTSPMGGRWQTLEAIVDYATNHWPTIADRIAARKARTPAKSVGGKRKATGGSPAKRAKLGSVTLSVEQREHNMKHRLCHKCGKPGHIARDCDSEESAPAAGTSKKKSKANNKSKEKSSEDF